LGTNLRLDDVLYIAFSKCLFHPASCAVGTGYWKECVVKHNYVIFIVALCILQNHLISTPTNAHT